MAMIDILKHIKVTRVMNAVAAGTTTQNGTGVDMTGFEGVLFVAAFGTLTATQVTSLNAQQSSDDGSTDTYDDLAGTKAGPLADADSNKLLAIDVYRPQKKFVRPTVVRGTANAVIDGVIAIQYNLKKEPSTQPTSVSASKAIVSPAEGTP